MADPAKPETRIEAMRGIVMGTEPDEPAAAGEEAVEQSPAD